MLTIKNDFKLTRFLSTGFRNLKPFHMNKIPYDLWPRAHAIYFTFKRTYGQLNSKDFRCVMTRAIQLKEQATTTLKRNLLNIFRKFYQRNLRLSFLDWEPNLGDNIHRTLLSSAIGLESPNSLAFNRASFLDSFSSIDRLREVYLI